jgi:polyvinyl alcohol dehydrogenase (cytochrome)
MMARLAPNDVPCLKRKWAFGYPGAVRAFAQPTIVAGRLFAGSPSGKVYSLHWIADVHTGVRRRQAGAFRHRHRPASGRLVSLFRRLGANVYAVDALKGTELWKTRIDNHPAARTGSPALVGATLFVPVSSIGGSNWRQPDLSVLQFPRQRRRVGSVDWKAAVERSYHSCRRRSYSNPWSHAGLA